MPLYLVLKDGSILLNDAGAMVLSPSDPPDPSCCCGGGTGCECFCVGGAEGYYANITIAGTGTEFPGSDGNYVAYGSDPCEVVVLDVNLTATNITITCSGTTMSVTVWTDEDSVTAEVIDGVATISGSFFGATLFTITINPCE
jgi:hypothetical protein